jgi:BNR/Asp-box repeat
LARTLRAVRPRWAGLATIAVLIMTLAPTSHADPSYRVVSRDPYTNTDAFHETEVEPAMYAYGSTIVAAFQMGRFDQVGASNLGFASSPNGGRTWMSGGLPGTTIYADPPGPYAWASEPSVTYSAKQGVWLIAGIAGAPGEEVFVSRSFDTRTWDAPSTVGRFGLDPFEASWVACDNWLSSPYYGNCYLKYDAQFELYAFVSHDGGLTWQTSQTPPNWTAHGGGMVVQPNGTVVMAVGDEYSEACCTFFSHDGGVSYQPYTLRGGVIEHPVLGNLRTYDFPSLAADDGGNLYVALYGCQFRLHCRTNDIELARGKDGAHWGPWRRVPIDPTTSRADHFLPAIAVEPGTSGSSAHLAITYWTYSDGNCTEATCRLSVGMIQSRDGGLTWDAPIHLAGPFSNAWYPLTDQGRMVGDYSSIAFVPGGALSVFAAAQPSACQLGQNDCKVAMAAPNTPVP